MSARKGKNLKRMKNQLKLLTDTTTNTSMRRALITAQKCVDKQIGKKLESWGACQRCPSCKVVHIYFDNYCPNCGQKIERWEAENNGK